tara:strand:+ start:850 stop:1158 length:309 start_codon:yes stop_codon:yes gene_type:complete
MQAKGEIMSIILAALIMSSVEVAEAKPARHHFKHRHHHNEYRMHRHRPGPPPSSRPAHNVTWRGNYWTYPHSNPSFIWKWKPGHYNMRGKWVPGHWRVVLRF